MAQPEFASAGETYALKIVLARLLLQFSGLQPSPQEYFDDFFNRAIVDAQNFSLRVPGDVDAIRTQIVDRLQDLRDSLLEAVQHRQ